MSFKKEFGVRERSGYVPKVKQILEDKFNLSPLPTNVSRSYSDKEHYSVSNYAGDGFVDFDIPDEIAGDVYHKIDKAGLFDRGREFDRRAIFNRDDIVWNQLSAADDM